MFYLVAGRIVLIEAFDEWIIKAVSEVFSSWFLTALSPENVSSPDATIKIYWDLNLPKVPTNLSSFPITNDGHCFTDEEVYYLTFESSLVVFKGRTARGIELWVDKPYTELSSTFIQLLSHALSPAIRRCGVFEIHSAAVIPPESSQAIMIAGPSGSGKSTLTSQLANAGWAYLSDDILLLRDADDLVEIHAFRRFFALTGDTMEAISLTSPKNVPATLKQRVNPQDHFIGAPVERARPAAIVFPTVTRQKQSRLDQLTSAETMSRLLRLCPWASYDKPTSVEHLRLLGRLASTTRGFELWAGTDILTEPDITREMFYNVAGDSVLAN